jgi:hypothetical protein
MKKLIFGLALSAFCFTLSAQTETAKDKDNNYRPHSKVGSEARCKAAGMGTADYTCKKPHTPRKAYKVAFAEKREKKKPEGTIPNLQPK